MFQSIFLRSIPTCRRASSAKQGQTLVCEKSLANFAKEINLGDYIIFGKGEQLNGGSQRPSTVSDAFEAVIAAIYLDGGFEAAKRHIMRFMPKDIRSAVVKAYDDYKTVLQEIIQKNPEESVEYKLVGESGPAHSKQFTVQGDAQFEHHRNRHSKLEKARRAAGG